MKHVRSILVLAGAALVAAATQTPRLQGVVGLWHIGSDGSVITDGARWNGKHTRAQMEPLAREALGEVSSTFFENALSASAFPLAVDRETARFTGGTIRVQFKLLSGPTDQSGGIVIGLRPSGEYRFVRYNTKDGNLALWGFAKGERQVLAKGEGLKQLPLGVWHELVVQVKARTVTASVTGHPTLDATFTLDAPVDGRVGLWAKRDVVTAFRNFSVQAAP